MGSNGNEHHGDDLDGDRDDDDGDEEGGGAGEDMDNEYRFFRAVQDPQGNTFWVEAVKSFGVSGPVSLHAPGRPWVERVLGVVNKGLVRVQPAARSHEGCRLEVTRVSEGQETVLLDESYESMDEGRRGALGVVARITAGTFHPARDG